MDRSNTALRVSPEQIKAVVKFLAFLGAIPPPQRHMRDPKLVATDSLSVCIKLITTNIRSERFCDGHLLAVQKSGTSAARFEDFVN
jgi:hypothetical protein